MDTAACYRATEARQQTFSRMIDESKTKNLDAAKNRSVKRCTAVCQDNAGPCIKSAGISQSLPLVFHVRAIRRHHSVPRDSISIGLIQQNAETVRQPVLFIWSVRSVWFVWLHETNQMDQTDRACPRRVGHRSSAVPKRFSRSLLELSNQPPSTPCFRIQAGAIIRVL